MSSHALPALMATTKPAEPAWHASREIDASTGKFTHAPTDITVGRVLPMNIFAPPVLKTTNVQTKLVRLWHVQRARFLLLVRRFVIPALAANSVTWPERHLTAPKEVPALMLPLSVRIVRLATLPLMRVPRPARYALQAVLVQMQRLILFNA